MHPITALQVFPSGTKGGILVAEVRADQPAGRKLFVRQSSGLVREVSVANALFFNTRARGRGDAEEPQVEAPREGR